jgi:hypothetical protein
LFSSYNLLCLFYGSTSSCFPVLFWSSCGSAFGCLKHALCYRESCEEYRVGGIVSARLSDLCCRHGMFPQRAYLSSRSWLNSAGWKLGWKSQPIIFIGRSFRSESRFFAKTQVYSAPARSRRCYPIKRYCQSSCQVDGSCVLRAVTAH